MPPILGSDRETTVFLRSVQNSKQLGFGIDHFPSVLFEGTTELHDRFKLALDAPHNAGSHRPQGQVDHRGSDG